MQEILKLIKDSIEVFSGTGRYLAVFLTCLLFLFINEKHIKEKAMMVFSFVLLFLLVSPFFANNTISFWVLSDDYWMLFYMLPVYIIIGYVATVVIHQSKSNTEMVIRICSMGLILFLSANYNYVNNYFSNLSIEQNQYKVSNEALEVAEALSDVCDTRIILEPELCGEIRKCPYDIRLLYGKDALEGKYADEPDENGKSISICATDISNNISNMQVRIDWADYYGSTCIVVSAERDDRTLFLENGFYVYADTDEYIVYRR